MKRIKQILKRILFPSKMKLICIPVVSFIILIFILTSQKSRTMPAYLIYCMSAYSPIPKGSSVFWVTESDLLYVGIFACNLAIGCTITDKTDKISYNK